MPIGGYDIDVLLYAHDGRGLGHASRAVAVGAALRRLAPQKRIVFLTGAPLTGALLGSTRLDWIKLPSYGTRVVRGASRGTRCPLGLADAQLAQVRSDAIAFWVNRLRPRVVLVDHVPSGKRDELLTACCSSQGKRSLWVLGVRAVLGDVPEFWSPQSARLIRERFRSVLWYGDASVTPESSLRALRRHCGITLVPVGYVSRAAELEVAIGVRKCRTPDVGCTVSIPWRDANTERVLRALTRVAESVSDAWGPWYVFAGTEVASGRTCGMALRRLSSVRHVAVLPIGSEYLSILARSRVALLHAGYNSIVDAIWAAVPAVVLVRDMQDGEQGEHMSLLRRKLRQNLLPLFEDPDPKTLKAAMLCQLQQPRPTRASVDIGGAERAASHLLRIAEWSTRRKRSQAAAIE